MTDTQQIIQQLDQIVEKYGVKGAEVFEIMLRSYCEGEELKAYFSLGWAAIFAFLTAALSVAAYVFFRRIRELESGVDDEDRQVLAVIVAGLVVAGFLSAFAAMGDLCSAFNHFANIKSAEYDLIQRLLK